MRYAVAAAVIAAAALSGCFDPFRVHVDPAAFGQSRVSWTETSLAQRDGGILGAKQVETHYAYQAQGPPFSGYLYVFGARWSQNPSHDALVQETARLVSYLMQSANITIDASKSQEGTRRLGNGLQTTWILREGTVSFSGDLFPAKAVVRVLGEVGMDGLSDTATIAIALVQIERRSECPLQPACQPVRDLVTWIDVAGDPLGTIAGATNRHGLVYNLVTH